MSLMKIYWVLFSSCLTTSCEASWILNSAGNTAHLLFLKVSTVWNGRISLLKAAPPRTDWELSSPFSIPPRTERQHHLASLVWLELSCCGRRHFPMFEPCWRKSWMVGWGCWFKWGIIIRFQFTRKPLAGPPSEPFSQLPWHLILILILI